MFGLLDVGSSRRAYSVAFGLYRPQNFSVGAPRSDLRSALLGPIDISATLSHAGSRSMVTGGSLGRARSSRGRPDFPKRGGEECSDCRLEKEDTSGAGSRR